MTPEKTTLALQKLAEAYVKLLKNNLKQGGHMATGALANSIKALPPVVTANGIEIPITALDYFDYLNKGVRGTKSGSGAYVFKSSMPSAEMVSSIQAFMRAKGITANTVKASVHSMARSRSTVNNQGAAFAIARSILQKGIPATGFATDALQAIQQQANNILGPALAADIAAALPKTL